MVAAAVEVAEAAAVVAALAQAVAAADSRRRPDVLPAWQPGPAHPQPGRVQPPRGRVQESPLLDRQAERLARGQVLAHQELAQADRVLAQALATSPALAVPRPAN
jgi:hypothetical protein